jgi:hypothetical protein
LTNLAEVIRWPGARFNLIEPVFLANPQSQNLESVYLQGGSMGRT